MRIYLRLVLLFLVLVLNSCEDVIDVSLQDGPSRLVVEASINWNKEASNNEQEIRLSTSRGFFQSESNPAVTGALVSLTNNRSSSPIIFEDQGDGRYSTDEFIPIPGGIYVLRIEYNNEIYIAEETLTTVSEINEVFQETRGDDEDDEIEIRVKFDDPENMTNNYLFKFKKETALLPSFVSRNDDFVDGNEISFPLIDRGNDDINEFMPGDVVEIEMFGISTNYYDYITILIDQIGGVGLFETTPTAVRGNCVNITNPENYAHGYFRLAQVNRISYTVQ